MISWEYFNILLGTSIISSWLMECNNQTTQAMDYDKPKSRELELVPEIYDVVPAWTVKNNPFLYFHLPIR